jgi:hypothetical protein
MSTTAVKTQSPATPAGSRTANRSLTVAAGAAAAAVVWVVASKAAKVPLDVKNGSKTQHVGIATVITVSLLAGLLAWGLATLLERRAKSPRRTWTVVALVVLLVSLTGPLSSGTTEATKVSLACEHLAVAAVLILGMARTVARR